MQKIAQHMPTIKELKDICKEKGLKRYSKLKKEDLMKYCFPTVKTLVNSVPKEIFDHVSGITQDTDDLIKMMVQFLLDIGIEDVRNFPESKLPSKISLIVEQFGGIKTFRANKTSLKIVGDECMVCKDSFKSNQLLVKTVCNHYMHKHCIKKWLNENSKTCSLCEEEKNK